MKIYLVGGAVRDQLLGLPVKERDWVVVGATPEDMLKQGYRQVGKEFPVFLHPKTNEEYALARLERKVQLGYKGFTFDTSPSVSLADDLLRRDLTINAMAETPAGELVDPYHGKEDLDNRILRHVSSAFGEDPVRILRIGRFLARYAQLGFTIAPETYALMRHMVEKGEVDALVAERVWKELERALGEPNPEQFFYTLAACHALPILFPHLTSDGAGMHALKQAAAISSDIPVRFAALLHAMPDDSADKQDAVACISALCHRYRVPNDYRELALMTARHYQTALDATHLTAPVLLDFFYRVDVFRRAERFTQFVQACSAIAASHRTPFDAAHLLARMQTVKHVSVKPFLEQGLTGDALARALKQARQAALE